MRINFVEIGNFRKLKSVRIGIAEETTVFVGANNSGKTSATSALRLFLVERERKNLCFNDVTLSHRATIDSMGASWETARLQDLPIPEPDWAPILPFLDVWLHAEATEAHLVRKLIPTLDWDGGTLGVRLRLEPKDGEQLQREFLSARADARRVEEADQQTGGEAGVRKPAATVLWPQSLTDFVSRRFGALFTVRSFILDPAGLSEPTGGVALPQDIGEEPILIDGEPFEGLLRIDEIKAQRGFGQDGSTAGDAEEPGGSGHRHNGRMSDQLRRYWNQHLDPFDSPDPEDLEALKAIEKAREAFDTRLRSGFSPAIKEVEGMGYPGVTDPRLAISTNLKPIDGLNHDAAVQYVVNSNGSELKLPESSNGLGYQNLISMIFRLMSFRDAWMRVGKAASAVDGLIPPLHLVLIEEPEAHLHTQVQQVFIRQAYKILRKHSALGESKERTTQLVVSTHSSHVAHECKFDQLRYFRRLAAKSDEVPVSGVVDLGSVFGEDDDTRRFVTRYVKLTHCDLFFADAVVFIEGPAERILAPLFVRHHPELKPLQECYVTWLEVGGSHAHRFRPLIEQLGLTALIITDLDACDSDNNKTRPTRGAGQKTRNSTLKTWCPGKSDLDALLDLKGDDKSKAYEAQRFAVRAAYQCPVEIEFQGSKSEVLPNTLEDALVFENTSLLGKTEGKGLWRKFHSSINNSSSADELAEAIHKDLASGDKAAFALDLLELEQPEKLQPPFYILDGLRWLIRQLHRTRQDLGITKPSATKADATGAEE